MQIISALLDKYDIDHSEFAYSARVNQTMPNKENT